MQSNPSSSELPPSSPTPPRDPVRAFVRHIEPELREFVQDEVQQHSANAKGDSFFQRWLEQQTAVDYVWLGFGVFSLIAVVTFSVLSPSLSEPDQTEQIQTQRSL